MRLAPFALGTLFVASLAVGQPTDTALGRFLQAADVNDVAAMKANMTENVVAFGGKSVTASAFLDSLSNCYLRRAYKNDINHTILAAWMCDEGAGKSRVVIADVRLDGQLTKVSVMREDHNDRPAPPRDGSAFGTGGKP